MAIRSRDERVDDIFFEDRTSEGSPAEEGLVRRVSDDLVVFIDGQVKSLTAGSIPLPTAVGDHLVSLNGTSYSSVQPVVSPEDGWLANWDSELIVEGLGA